MTRIETDDLRKDIQEALHRCAIVLEAAGKIDVCIVNPAGETWWASKVQEISVVLALAGELAVCGYAVATTKYNGCDCDYVFEPIDDSDEALTD